MMMRQKSRGKDRPLKSPEITFCLGESLSSRDSLWACLLNVLSKADALSLLSHQASSPVHFKGDIVLCPQENTGPEPLPFPFIFTLLPCFLYAGGGREIHSPSLFNSAANLQDCVLTLSSFSAVFYVLASSVHQCLSHPQFCSCLKHGIW